MPANTLPFFEFLKYLILLYKSYSLLSIKRIPNATYNSFNGTLAKVIAFSNSYNFFLVSYTLFILSSLKKD